jgi:hypothetical protein
MPVTDFDGFDLYPDLNAPLGLFGRWLGGLHPATGGISAANAGRFGGRSVGAGANGSNLFYRSVTNRNQLSNGVAFRVSSMPAHALTAVVPIVLYSDANGTFTAGVGVHNNGVLGAYRLTSSTAGVVLGTSAINLVKANVWHYLEVELVLGDANGRITVFLDGVMVLNLTNVDTNNGIVSIGRSYLSMQSSTCDFDDWYLTNDPTRLGERRVETIRPSADTAQKQFTADTGTVNFSRVNDAVADSATFVQSSTVGHTDLYDLVDLSSTPVTIDAVNVVLYAMKTDAMTRAMAILADVNGTQMVTADLALAGSISRFDTLLLTKPGGGNWAASDVAGLRIGPRVTV